MPVIAVPRAKAEFVRKKVYDCGLLDLSRKIVDMGEVIKLPIKTINYEVLQIVSSVSGAEIQNGETPPRILKKAPFQQVCERVGFLPDSLKAKLPSFWEMIGDILLLRIPDDLKPWEKSIAKIYAEVLGAKTVAEIVEISGLYREQKVRLLYGADTITIHKENGVKYKMDVARVMFSSGNVDERIRMARIDMGSEVVVDMFAGIGYFSLPIAVHTNAARVIAYEVNPVAYRYLIENIELNKVASKVVAHNMDCLRAEEDVADRVVMGYVHDTHMYLEKAIKILRGKGVIHFHEAVPERAIPEGPLKRIKNAVRRQKKQFRIQSWRKIKSYAPGVSHVVFDIEIV